MKNSANYIIFYHYIIRRTKATDYLIQSDNKYIRWYFEGDLVKILKDSGYHSEEWEEMDADDDDIITEESVDSNLIYLLSFAICYMNKSI
jgi:hypothetical protein